VTCLTVCAVLLTP